MFVHNCINFTQQSAIDDIISHYKSPMAQRLKSINNILSEQSRLKSIRSKSQLNAKQLKDLLFQEGTYDKYIQPMYDFYDSNKDIFTHHNIEGQTRPQIRQEAARMMLAILKFSKIDLINQPLKLVYHLWATTMYDGGIVTKSFLPFFLYAKSLVMFQSHPKHQELIANAHSLSDIGCFGLTEFHHGSYSKEVQTLATYDHKTRQFAISTQGRKGMKYWIGAASQVANMSVIWAQLIIDGKSQGPHPFVVPIRCKKTHQILPGITIGDCGLKNGLNYIDNGYIIMDNVRIPSYYLLGKLGSVDENGVYNSMIQSNDMRFGFHMSPLSGGRGVISFIGNIAALKSVTCALRYACTRKQFDNPKKTDEVLIIDYQLTKLRLIPYVAQIAVQIHPGLQLARAYFQNPEIFNDMKYVGQLHAVSAATKVRIAWNCTAVAQETRSILGGHGYSAYSNFVNFFQDFDVNNTWEGDNNMLLQQTSKYLMKTIGKQSKTKIVDLSFIWNLVPVDEDKIIDNLRSLQTVQALLRDLIVIKYNNAKRVFDELSKQYSNKNDVWLHFHPQAGNSLSLSFADLYLFNDAKGVFLKAVNQKNKEFLFKCLLLWTFNLLQSERYGSSDLRRALRKEITALCDELTEPAVVFTDTLLPSVHIVGSVFANYQGKGLQQFLSNLYAAKDTFSRVPYYDQIIKARNSN